MNLGLSLGLTRVAGGGAAISQLVQGATAGWFLDPAGNVPANTSKIEFQASINLPASFPASYVFSATSTSIEAALQANGSVTGRIEDGTGATMLNTTMAPSGTVVAGVWQDWIFIGDQSAEELTLSIGGSSTTTAFTGTSNGSFQTARPVSVGARSTGTLALPDGTQIRDIKIYFDDVLHKEISNIAAEANADAWHQGGDFT